ncbi:MAG: hypothetical protein ACRYFU_03805 [Janthinobacterium lividum]
MDDGKQAEDTPIEDARIMQASVMDETSVLFVLSNGSSALLNSEEITKLLANSATKIVRDDEVAD